ncbi:hypothetical protein FEF65_12910 [Mariprofundus erugo]|uniref:Uncharacterized protein n=1 Tax=Mariprofundus erugo TaxID=2528639 RepID=A0A5R9GJQ0_9PROT|nr:hypothetical protein [Mariprofundus erugo]TLS65455.1 hypothetical protein FEF65_12910 [Mariprofundus erugo]
MKVFSKIHRHQAIQKIRGELERDSFPRLQMFLLVTLTGASGFVASYTFLHVGIVEMWLRYLLSFGVAYLMFLVLLWLWLRTRAEDYADIPEVSRTASSSSDSASACCSGKGGDFGGGSASGAFDSHADGISLVGDSGGSVSDALGTVAEAEEFAIPLAILMLIGAMVFSSLFIVYSAPMLFAELLVDGVLSASLYRRLRGLETRHWLETAIRRTACPFILTAAIASASGWAMTLYAPGVHSIGDVIFYLRQGG